MGALVQFLLDERDSLLESLDAEEVAAMAVIEDNLKTVEMNVKAVDKAIADINKHTSGKTSFEVSPKALVGFWSRPGSDRGRQRRTWSSILAR